MAHIEQPHEGATNDWWTPPELVQALGEFDLDPCAGVGQTPLARGIICPPDDGLASVWSGRIWCNPPYGPYVALWAKKMSEHMNGILLIFARTETRAWQQIWNTATGILLPSRRITFHRPDGTKAKSGTAPSAFVAYGNNNVEALFKSGIKGTILTEWETNF
jgi:DNA N-6-adenine-methyltransferase Dam